MKKGASHRTGNEEDNKGTESGRIKGNTQKTCNHSARERGDGRGTLIPKGGLCDGENPCSW